MEAYDLKDSGVDWLGSIPKHWKCKPLKRYCVKTSTGRTPDTGNAEYYSENTGIKWFSPECFDTNKILDIPKKFITNKAIEDGQAKIYSENSVYLVGIGATAGKVSISIDRCSANQQINILETSFKLNPDFLYYQLKIIEKEISIFSQYTTLPIINKTKTGYIPICVPSIEEQKAIANYLDKACQNIDKTIPLKQQQLTSIVKQQDDIIQTAVNKGINRNIELKNSGIDWIGAIPIHWKVKRLKRVLKESDYGISVSTEEEGKFSVLKMGNIENRKINDSKIEFVQEVDEKFLVINDDLLFNRTNSHDQVGKVGIYNGNLGENVTYASYLVRLRPNHLCSPHFLNYYLNNSAFLNFARRMAIPSVQQANLNPNRYGRLEIAVPPIDEQHEIVKFLDIEINNLENLKEVLKNQIKTLTQYRQSLIHECVTGKKRIYQGD